MTQREDMDQHVVLSRRGQAFTVRDKVFQLGCAFATAQLAPDVVAKSHHRAKMRIREFGLEGRQFIDKYFAGRTQGIHIPFHIGFNPNRRAAMFWQNATLNLRHRSS
ncbi:hypothetical protein D3C76_1240960 [compost metagenome]